MKIKSIRLKSGDSASHSFTPRQFLIQVGAIVTMLPMLKVTTPAMAVDLDPQHVGSWPGYHRRSASSVAVIGHYAYVAAESLQVIDVSNPVQPRRVGSHSSSASIYDIAAASHYVYIPIGTGLQIPDVSNPTQPQLVGEYTTNNRGRLEIIDVSDPAVPRKVA